MMRLNAKMLKNVYDVNVWEYADSAYVQEGQTNEFYFQLVDLDKTHDQEKSKVLPDFPLRYIPIGTVITLTVTFPDVNPDNVFTAVASQPFSQDLSIFKVTLPSSQTPNSGSLEVSLDIDGTIKTFIIKNALRVESNDLGGC